MLLRGSLVINQIKAEGFAQYLNQEFYGTHYFLFFIFLPMFQTPENFSKLDAQWLEEVEKALSGVGIESYERDVAKPLFDEKTKADYRKIRRDCVEKGDPQNLPFEIRAALLSKLRRAYAEAYPDEDLVRSLDLSDIIDDVTRKVFAVGSETSDEEVLR